LLNQSDHGTFSPATSDRWQEIWFPYSGIGEMTGASPQLVLSLTNNDNGYELGLYPLEAINDSLIIKEDKKKYLIKKYSCDRLKRNTSSLASWPILINW